MELENFSVKEVDQVIEYGIERGKVIFLTTFIVMMLGWLFGVFSQGIVFWLSFSALRRYAGGYHADTQKRCYIISFIVVILSFMCIRRAYYVGLLGLLIQMISLLIILFLAPVENQNRVLDKNEKKRYGIKTKIIAMLLSLLYFLLYIVNKPQIAIPIVVAFVVVTISLIAGYLKNIKKSKCKI